MPREVRSVVSDADISGSLLADRLVRAADRGVRVRVLLDDRWVRLQTGYVFADVRD